MYITSPAPERETPDTQALEFPDVIVSNPRLTDRLRPERRHWRGEERAPPSTALGSACLKVFATACAAACLIVDLSAWELTVSAGACCHICMFTCSNFFPLSISCVFCLLYFFFFFCFSRISNVFSFLSILREHPSRCVKRTVMSHHTANCTQHLRCLWSRSLPNHVFPNRHENRVTCCF